MHDGTQGHHLEPVRRGTAHAAIRQTGELEDSSNRNRFGPLYRSCCRTAHGNGQLYLALWSQSFQEETVRLVLDRARVQCDQGREARVWRDHVPGAPIRVVGNQLTVTIAPKGIVAFAIPDLRGVKETLKLKWGEKTCPLLPGGKLGGFHTRTLSTMPEVELVGVSDPNLLRAQMLAWRHNCVAYKTVPAVVFSTSRGGDWVDRTVNRGSECDRCGRPSPVEWR